MNARSHIGTTSLWGPLAEPVHDPPPAGRPPFRDNAYLGFWDVRAGVFGVVHVSTSHNAEGRRARLSLATPAGVTEIVEELEPGTFCSRSLTFELDGRVRIDHADLGGDLLLTPRFALADYSQGGIIPALGQEAPPTHFQRFASVQGALRTRDGAWSLDGTGVRDRTWGYRDESASIAEYIAIIAGFDDFGLTAMRFLGTDGKMRTEGHLVDTAGATPVADLAVTRDASGLFVRGAFSLREADELAFSTVERPAGFWVPMGWERTGPTLSAYDEFVKLRTPDGRAGVAIVEQASLRRVF